MLNPERKAKLIAALRSGEFPQTRGCLRDMDGYCCLGVACEIFRRETDTGEWCWDETEQRFKFQSASHRDSAVLPWIVEEWLSAESRNLEYDKGPYVKTSLSEKNDRGFSFNEIADILEKKF